MWIPVFGRGWKNVMSNLFHKHPSEMLIENPPQNGEEISTFVKIIHLQIKSTVQHLKLLSHVGVTYKMRFGFDDWIYCTLFTHNFGLQTIKCYRYSSHFTVHCCTCSRVLSLHELHPSNGFHNSLTVASNHT
jgi:hypothetical protein